MTKYTSSNAQPAKSSERAYLSGGNLSSRQSTYSDYSGTERYKAPANYLLSNRQHHWVPADSKGIEYKTMSNSSVGSYGFTPTRTRVEDSNRINPLAEETCPRCGTTGVNRMYHRCNGISK